MAVFARLSVSKRITVFDRSIIKTNWKRINRSPLQQAGIKVRQTAIGSIRTASERMRGLSKTARKPSKPGRPPRSWKLRKKTKGRRGGNPPFKMIFSVPEKLGTSVVVWMVGFTSKAQPVPGLHEHGGRARRTVYEKRRQRSKTSGRFIKSKGFPVTKSVSYPERPFMFPALQKQRKNLPKLWKGSLNRE